MKPKALIFDMDGVLTDNLELHEAAWLDFAQKIGVKTEKEDIRKTIFGRRNKEIMDSVFGRHLVSLEIEKLIAQKEKVYMNLAKGRLKPLSGLLDFLTAAKTRNIPMAVATSSEKEVLIFTLNELGLNEFFPKVRLSANDVKEGKPSPEIFQICAIRLGYEAEDCLVFEDSIPGIRAARSSGATVAVPLTTLNDEEAKKENPDLIFKNFSDKKIHELVF